MNLTADNVEAVLVDCLLSDEEAHEYGLAPEDPEQADPEQIAQVVDLLVADGVVVKVEGILNPFALHRERLEGHRQDVREMLDDLPDSFRLSGGGGWTFLNLCMTKDDEQWTGLHRTQDHLCVLAIGLGLGSYAGPREMWVAFPGGLPYFTYLDKEPEPEEAEEASDAGAQV